MIKINLLLKKNHSSSGASLVDDLESALAKIGIKKPKALMQSFDVRAALFQGIVLVVMVLIAGFFWSKFKQSQMASLMERRTELTTEVQKIDQEMRKYSGYEVTKKELEDNERLILRKIDTIETLIRERSNGVKLLIGLSEVTPKEVWLTSLNVNEKETFSLTGQGYGLGAVSQFMGTLESSVLFKQAILKSGTQRREDGIEIANFALEVVRK